MQRTCLSTHDCLKIVLDALVNKSIEVEVIRRRRGIGMYFCNVNPKFTEANKLHNCSSTLRDSQSPSTVTVWIFVTLPG